MKINKKLSGAGITFELEGKFSFSDHQAFRDIIKIINTGKYSNITFDFSGLDFVDSAALGMLIVARDESKKNNINLDLKGATGQVKKMFDLSNFDSLFKMV